MLDIEIFVCVLAIVGTLTCAGLGLAGFGRISLVPLLLGFGPYCALLVADRIDRWRNPKCAHEWQPLEVDPMRRTMCTHKCVKCRTERFEVKRKPALNEAK
ncbi:MULTISPECIES: hypothetical protein [unclassified Caballeronia]|uniref:hypothetical protein n=1 Tax=unclassified Caballeronia TaxID=2646786 RepID=UPI002855EC3A|nr:MULTISPECIES: hypothetical protein [unclassified Caballeronia]MDR5776918.1 hypothetical protein [Caballeronia sp. LZ002]MDR5798775.1 hypothetical protein [Caballeronia sp. LZ001]MDR5852297.1 hypothetical protein [Caballeronia sp. LZ003]